MLIAREACDLAGVDPNRLNEAIARGDFPCAPVTIAGGRRVFDERDFVVLAIFGAMTGRGMPPRLAAEVACMAFAPVTNDPAAPALAVLWRQSRLHGPRIEGITPDIGYAMHQMRVPKASEVASGDQDAISRAYFPVFSVEIINVAALRAKFQFLVLQKKSEPEPDFNEEFERVADAFIAALKKGVDE